MNPTEKSMRVRGERLLDSALDTLDAVPVILVPTGDLVIEAAKLEARAGLVRDELAKRSAERMGPTSRGWDEAPPSPPLASFNPGGPRSGFGAAAAARALPMGERSPRRRKGRR